MLIERITAALHLPDYAVRADGEADHSTPEGQDCTCYFLRDWVPVFLPRGGESYDCTSSLLGVFAHNDDGTITAYSRDEAEAAFGLPWVMAVQADDAEAAE
jgi:hypothetical protein